MITFFDSSALAKRYVAETGTDVVLRLIDDAELVLASRLTWLEVTAAVSRAARDGVITKADEIVKALDEDFAVLININEVTPTVVSEARTFALRHVLRAGDALQLATAMAAMAQWEARDRFRFVSSDLELNRAAEQEKLVVLNPVEM